MRVHKNPEAPDRFRPDQDSGRAPAWRRSLQDRGWVAFKAHGVNGGSALAWEIQGPKETLPELTPVTSPPQGCE